MRRNINVQDLYKRLVSGDRFALSKAITLVESTLKEDQQLSSKLMSLLSVSGGKRIGISGPPGVGKSSFIEAFGLYLVEKGMKVAVLAIDPSSSIGKGSILGDKTRMEALSQHPQVYIRPSPSGGHLGGVARKTRETMLLCQSAGYEIVIIETVGVGQSEIAVRNMVDLFLLLVQPAGGDEVQGIKKGIVEMADLIAVTKADGNMTEKAKITALQYQTALHYYPYRKWKTEVLLCSALEKKGIGEIWEQICKYFELTDIAQLRKKQNVQAMYESIRSDIEELFYNHSAIKRLLPEFEQQVETGKIQPHIAATQLLEVFIKHL